MFSIVLKFVTTIQSYSYYSMRQLRMIRRQPSLPTLSFPTASIKQKTETKKELMLYLKHLIEEPEKLV